MGLIDRVMLSGLYNNSRWQGIDFKVSEVVVTGNPLSDVNSDGGFGGLRQVVTICKANE